MNDDVLNFNILFEVFMGVESYLILSAVKPNISPAMFRRLMLGTDAMLAFAHREEPGSINAGMDFGFGNYG